MQDIAYALSGLLAAVILVSLGIYSWRFRYGPATFSFVLFLSFCAAWILADVFMIFTPTLAGKVLWLRVRFTATTSLPLALLVLTYRYIRAFAHPGERALHTGVVHDNPVQPIPKRQRTREYVLSIAVQALLLDVPGITWALLWGGGSSGPLPFLLYNIQITRSASSITFMPGPWFGVYLVYSYSLIGVALVFAVRSMGNAPVLYVRQMLLVIVGMLVPLMATIVGMMHNLAGLGKTPMQGDTPVLYVGTFFFMGAALGWALLHDRFLDVQPVARGSLLENMEDGILALDARGRIVDFNPAVLLMLGLASSPEEIRRSRQWIGQPAHLVLANWPNLLEAIEAVLHSDASYLTSQPGPVRSVELGLPTAAPLNAPDENEHLTAMLGDGQQAQRCLEARIALLWEANGKHPGRSRKAASTAARRRLINLVITLRDISLRKQAEEQIQQLKELHEGILQNMLEGVVLDDAQGYTRFFNPAAAAMMGRSPQEMHGQHWKGFIPPDQWPVLEAANARRSQGQAGRYEVELLRKNGERLTVLISGMPQIAHTGQLSGSLGVFTDISARKRAEQALRASEERHRLLVEQLGMLNRIGLAITSALSIDGVIHTLYQQCQQIGPIDSFYVALYDDVTGEAHFPVLYDRGAYRSFTSRNIWEQPGLTGYVIQMRRTLYISDLTQPDIGEMSEGSVDNPGEIQVPVTGLSDTGAPVVGVRVIPMGSALPRTFLGVPLILRDRVVGVISMQCYQPGAYTPEQVHMLEMVAIPAAIAIENSRLYEQARYDITRRWQAWASLQQTNKRLKAQLAKIKVLQGKLRAQIIRDPLTGLYNRGYLHVTLRREMAQALRSGCLISLVMMDIDHFKDLNDRYGHQAGDLVLQELGKLLRKSSRQGDIACRYGGEEFVVVMPGASLENARQRAVYWQQSFYALHIPYEQHDLHATLSIGVAVFPAHGVSEDEVLNAADRAMYMAKNRGRNCVVTWGGGNPDV